MKSNRRYTPERIEELKENECFVFGSNKRGEHIGGAARIARDKFGAIDGVAEGSTDLRTYAIPTLDENFKPVPVYELAISIAYFLSRVRKFPQVTFYLTKIGCGIAGWDIGEVRRIFWSAIEKTCGNFSPDNLIYPKEFEENE